MAGADLAAVVNPNNPDGQNWSHEIITDLAGKVDQLMVDESFADAETGLSLAPRLKAPSENVIVLRCFGKFFGLAGVRLGFVLAGPKTAALADREWHRSISGQLHADAARLLALLDATAGCPTIGAKALFVTFETGNALQARANLARAHLDTRLSLQRRLASPRPARRARGMETP